MARLRIQETQDGYIGRWKIAVFRPFKGYHSLPSPTTAYCMLPRPKTCGLTISNVLDFDTRAIGSNTTKAVIVRNISTATVHFRSFVVSGASGVSVKVNGCGRSLAKGRSCSISLTWKPTAVGAINETLSIEDDVQGSPQTVTIRGVAGTPGDFNGDGYADALAFYNFGGSHTQAFLFPGKASGINPPTMIWDSGPGKWNWTSTMAVSGDFNGDGYADALAFYNFGGSHTQVFLFPGKASGINPPTMIWDSGPGKWNWTSTKAVSGDFNKDGYADVIAFYSFGGAHTKAFLFRGKASGINPPKKIWDSGPGKWNMTNTKAVSGDFNKDGYADVLAFYNSGGAHTKVFLFRGKASGINPPKKIWDSGPGKWNWTSTKFVSGDFNKDGYADVIAFCNSGGAHTKAFLFRGKASGINPPTMIWDSGPGKWNWTSTKAVSGDFNGDGYADVLAFYNFGGSHTQAFLFPGKASGINPPTMIWDSGPGKWNWESSFFFSMSYVN